VCASPAKSCNAARRPPQAAECCIAVRKALSQKYNVLQSAEVDFRGGKTGESPVGEAGIDYPGRSRTLFPLPIQGPAVVDNFAAT
jgi:hypothetical protein